MAAAAEAEQWRDFKFCPPPCTKHHTPPAPATSFAKLCLAVLIAFFCHMYILGCISSINVASFYLMDKDLIHVSSDKTMVAVLRPTWITITQPVHVIKVLEAPPLVRAIRYRGGRAQDFSLEGATIPPS